MTSIIHNFTRINVSIILAGLVTFSLFFIMQLLISFKVDTSIIETRLPIGPITIPPEVIEIITVTPIPEKPIDPAIIPPIEYTGRTTDAPGLFSLLPPTTIENPEIVGPAGLANLDVLAIVQVAPTYPSIPLSRGIEGFVLLKFNINEVGVVVEPTILISEPSGVFDRAALKAIQRWKYNPKIIDGSAVKVTGVQQKMVFTIKD